MDGMGKALVVLPYSPNKIRVRSLVNLTEIAELYEVDLVYLYDGLKEEIPASVKKVVRIDNSSQLKRAIRVLLGLLRKKPITYQYYHSWALRDVLHRLDLDDYDVVFVERLPLHELHIDHPNLVFDAVDCFSSQVDLLKRVRGRTRILYSIDSILIRPYETRVCNCASRVLVTTEAEKLKLENLGVSVNIEPHLNGLQFKILEEPRFNERDYLLLSFHGKLTYKPNRVALDVIRDFIIPELKEGFKLQIVGFTTKALMKQYKQFEFTGYVDDLMDAISVADLAIFPIEVCVGVQLKVLESLACGVPSVITPQMKQGLPRPELIIDQGVFVAEIENFAATIRRYKAMSIEDKKDLCVNCIRYIKHIDDKAFRIKRLCGNSYKTMASQHVKLDSNVNSGTAATTDRILDAWT